MARRKRFTGHRNHMGHYIGGMKDMPPPGMQTGDDNASSTTDLRRSSYSVPPKDVITNEEYPFGHGGVYIVPIGTKR